MTSYGIARRIDLVAAWVRLRGPLETDPTWFADVASTLEAIAAEVRERARQQGRATPSLAEVAVDHPELIR